jgi:hypothetical protein
MQQGNSPKILRLFLATKVHKLNEKFLEVSEPFFKKVLTRRRQK